MYHCGDDSVGDPPVLIPNTEVKPYCADGTGLATSRESRKLPHSKKKHPTGVFLFTTDKKFTIYDLRLTNFGFEINDLQFTN